MYQKLARKHLLYQEIAKPRLAACLHAPLPNGDGDAALPKTPQHSPILPYTVLVFRPS
jgi:hypothetical protein